MAKGPVFSASPLSLTIDSELQSFVIEEVEGAAPVRVLMRGGFMPERGAQWTSETKGGKTIPIGARKAILSATSEDVGDTELSLNLDAAFLKPNRITVTGLSYTFTPEGILDLFEQLRARARLCNVQVGPMARVGILRQVKATPKGGYAVNPATGDLGSFGVNLDVVLKFEWSSFGVATVAPITVVDGRTEAGILAAADGKIAAGITDPFAPDLFTGLNDAIGNFRAGVTGLRNAVKGVGDLARAPARVANNAFAAARSVGNVYHDLDNVLADTADEYKLAAAGGSIARLMGAKRSAGSVRDGANDAMDSACRILDALINRKRKVVGCRPGDSLAAIAKKYLGDAGRWSAIADANGLAGQIVPTGTYSLEIPPG